MTDTTKTNPRFIAPRLADKFDALLLEKFGEEQTGISPERYEHIVTAWNGAVEACEQICAAIEIKYWNDFKGRYIGPHPRPELQGNSHVEGMSDGAGECASALRS